MAKNCWEFKNCGREVGGAKVAQLGVCTASKETRVHGINHGKNGGRACWALAGTLCGGVVQGTFAAKMTNCKACEFYGMVRSEEGTGYTMSQAILARIS
jgi:hypothetical protein